MSPPYVGTTNHYYDEFGHVVLETDSAGNSLREYIWLGDMPVAIIDEVETTAPALYYVHADHLNRLILVTNSAGAVVWPAVWKPFGEPESITGSLTYDARFPGQWFQIESGLSWNWNRHYDPGTGRYLQPDPLGLAAMLADGPSIYGYARQAPLAWLDKFGRDADLNSNFLLCLAPGGGGDKVHACQQAFNQCREYAEQLYDKGWIDQSHALHEGCALTLKTCYFNENTTQNNPFVSGMTTLFPPNKNENGGGFVDHQKGSPPVYYPPTTDPIGPLPHKPSQ